MSKKKTVKKTALKKTSPKAAKKTKTTKEVAAKKKTPAPKAKKVTPSKKVAAKKESQPASKGERAKTPSKAKKTLTPTAILSREETHRAEILQRRKRRATPAIFKIKTRKHTPVVFTLDDVHQVIHKRKAEGKEMLEDLPKIESKTTKKLSQKLNTPTPKSVHGAASLSDILGFNPATRKHQTLSNIDESQIPSKWKKCYKALVSMRQQVTEGLDLHTKETLHRSTQDDSGNLSNYSQHIADAGTDSFDRDFALSLVSSEQEALQEIEGAIQRIVNGTYGICEITGEAIKKERLIAVPFTRYSLEGQRQLERNRQKKTDRGGAYADFGSDDSISLTEDDE